MFIKLSVILFLLCKFVAKGENHEWDLAVVINDQIELLQSNGSLVGATIPQFSKLRALTFDNVRHQFVVSDMDQQNDTIFTVQLTKETDISPLVENLPDDVQGLAIDPITDTLYWTDSINGTINYVSLNDSEKESKIFHASEDQKPQDIVVDVCHRYIYWTNANHQRPTIERAKLDGTSHEVLIHSDLRLPAGIAIDYSEQRLYWADKLEGIYYRIESTNLEGKERETVYEGTHLKPFGVAVDEESIYWTDINNNALWRIQKYRSTKPEKLREFVDRPMGLVAKNLEITTLPDCKNLAQAVKRYNESTVEVFIEETDEPKLIMECLNGGRLAGNACKCLRGFTGNYCETDVCHNFCVYGNCRRSASGFPMCDCHNGFTGSRCEKDICEDFCLNDGRCTYSYESRSPKCNCPHEFAGIRCEIGRDMANLCEIFCKDKEDDVLYSRTNDFLCRCDGGSYEITKANNTSVAELFFKNEKFLSDHLQDPAFLILSCVLLILLVVTISLGACVCTLRRRPRIKKRIIVNKNITPLTYRPQPTSEQCEITIEDCCNMNVCETPCFEPPKLSGYQKKTDDKKNLLSNMENGEDLY